MTTTTFDNRFYRLLRIANFSGIICDLFTVVLIYTHTSGYEVLSPVLGTLFFVLNHFFLRNKPNLLRISFVLASIIISFQIVYHTYLLGWDGGFYFFFLLLPTIFLLNLRWSKQWILWYNLFFFAVLFSTFFLLFEKTPEIIISSEQLQLIFNLNLLVVILVIFLVLIFFQRLIREKDVQLIAQNEELTVKNKEITQQRDQLEVLLKEVHHRVKNNLQVISSLVSLQLNDMQDDKAKYALEETQRRIASIALIHQKLYQGKDIDKVRFNDYLQEIVDYHFSMNPNVSTSINYDQHLVLDLDLAMPLGLIVSELISNSYKHAFKGVEDPKLNIVLSDQKGYYSVIVSDNGIGLPEDFSLLQADSLGMEIIQALAEQINAELNYKSQDGTIFYVNFKKN